MGNWLGIVLYDPRPPEKTFEIVEMNCNLEENNNMHRIWILN